MNLRSLDVTNARGNGINNTGWVAVTRALPETCAERGRLFHGRQVSLGTLGGSNSSVAQAFLAFRPGFGPRQAVLGPAHLNPGGLRPSFRIQRIRWFRDGRGSGGKS